MQLPDKVRNAIAILGQYDIPRDTVAPFWYRQFLRLRPETPPPLWGASERYWSFVAEVTTLMWFAVTSLGLSLVVWLEISDAKSDRGALWFCWFLGQLIFWTVFGSLARAESRAKHLSATRDASALGLPDWSLFSMAWRPAIDKLHKRTQPSHFWLRGLWVSPLAKWSAGAGALVFVLLAWAFPANVGGYGQLTTQIYLVSCMVAVLRSMQRRPLASHSVGWFGSQGFWMGSVLAAAGWEAGLGQLAGQPPVHDTLYYAAIAFALHASDAYNYQQQRDLAMRAERAEQSRQLAEVRLQMLKTQIEPHFIFNTLAHLKALIRIDPVVAESMADELSDFLRASLQSLREDRMTVTQDFELVRAYLALASLRMGKRLTVDLQMDPATAKLQVPPLMLQTLVENAIQHGVEPKVGAGHICVSARLDSSSTAPRLVLEVADDGVGFGQATTGGSGLGLVNIRERLATTFGQNAQLTLGANTPQGVIATLSLPASTSP